MKLFCRNTSLYPFHTMPENTSPFCPAPSIPSASVTPFRLEDMIPVRLAVESMSEMSTMLTLERRLERRRWSRGVLPPEPVVGDGDRVRVR